MEQKTKCEKDQPKMKERKKPENVRADGGDTKLTLSSKSPSEIFMAFHNVGIFIGLRIIILQSNSDGTKMANHI